MKKIGHILAVSILFGATALTAQEWVPAACKDRMGEIRRLRKLVGIAEDVEAEWQKNLKAVRDAKPGGSYFVPKPFPKTRDEILQNFRYTYFDKLFEGRSVDQLPEEERPIYSALEGETIDIRIARVTNWRLSRCDGHLPAPYFYLLRLYDRTTGREVARFTMEHTGIMGIYGHVTPSAERALLNLDTLETELQTRFGRSSRVEMPQYVAVDGVPYRCNDKQPCAWRSGLGGRSIS